MLYIDINTMCCDLFSRSFSLQRVSQCGKVHLKHFYLDHILSKSICLSSVAINSSILSFPPFSPSNHVNPDLHGLKPWPHSLPSKEIG